MPLKPCPDCEHSVSERATSCPNCGCPLQSEEESGVESRGAWQAVMRSRTPINVFALAMMACASVFGFSATRLGDQSLVAFTYSLHIFLAIAGMFFACLLFCRNAIYHPDDLAKAKAEGVDLGRDRPLLAASLIILMLLAYGLYQGYTLGAGE